MLPSTKRSHTAITCAAPSCSPHPEGTRLTTPAYQRERRRPADARKALRGGAGPSGSRLSELLGWQQSKVSKIETRKQLPSEEDISAWVGAAGGSPETASELLAALRGARVEYAAWKDAYRDSGA